MASRGRGGKTTSLTQEQLQALGSIGKDIPQVQTAPPETFPPLMSKPVTLETTAAQNYQILWKEDFLNQMRDSPYYLLPKEISKTKIQKYSDQYAESLENFKSKSKADFPWHLMPHELLPANNKRKVPGKSKSETSKKPKSENINDRLKILEEKEQTESDTEATHEKKTSDSENENEEEEDAQADEEMDDENDYGHSYFDNGEAYNEEDDNLDDGPVY